MPNYCRTDKYVFVKPNVWNMIPDVEDNSFKPLINNLSTNKLSVNIDGRAGIGKSTFINQLVEHFDKNSIA